jgi:hypothetical protein
VGDARVRLEDDGKGLTGARQLGRSFLPAKPETKMSQVLFDI